MTKPVNEHQTQLVAALETVLAAQADATGALAVWAKRQGFAEADDIRIKHVIGSDAIAPPDARQLLEIRADEPIAYRHIRLQCGARLLSQAHNWFVPSRLTPAMNHTLAVTDLPFGRVVAALRFTRQKLLAPQGCSDAICPAQTILTHRAILRRRDSLPISLVVECYQRAALEDGEPE